MNETSNTRNASLKNLWIAIICVFAVGVFTNCYAKAKLQEVEKIIEDRDELQQEIKIETQKEAYALPEDTTAKFDVSSIEISGNTCVATEILLSDIPPVYNASDIDAPDVDSALLFDLSPIINVLQNPGTVTKVSARTIQGFTQYLLKVYQKRGYGGVYIYVPTETFKDQKQLVDNKLVIKVIEAKVSDTSINFFDIDGKPNEDNNLKSELVEEWSPIEKGKPIKQKELDDFLNLLNLNPDRYVNASVAKGEEPDTLNVSYNIYETDPWHYFLQVDNSGTSDRRWSPRIGLINTNLTGHDDILTLLVQAPVHKKFSKHNYSAYASYDVPILTQRLRLNLFGARSEFEVDGGGGIDFLGNGTVWGGKLRYNLYQQDSWFLDATTGVSFEKTKVTTTLFATSLGQETRVDLWNYGLDLHRSEDLKKTSISLWREERIGGSKQVAFWDEATNTGARTNAKSDFAIWHFDFTNSAYRNHDKIERLLTSFKYIRPDARLIPSKLTTFGGMYSVRGYEESAIVTDGGILASIQYEYDLVKHDQAKYRKLEKERKELKESNLRKLSVLGFLDYGQADIKDPVAGEKRRQELLSVGPGVLFEWGKNLSGGCYYGYPLREATGTATGDGRVNVYFMLQW